MKVCPAVLVAVWCAFFLFSGMLMTPDTATAKKKSASGLDLTIRLSACPDYVVPGKPLRDKIKVVATNTGKKTVEATVELILSRKKNYICPVPFAVYCPTYKDYVLLKGGRMLLSLPPGSTEVVFKGSNAIPPDTKEGIYYLGAVIDAGNMVPETNEKNNAYFRKVFVTRHVPKDRVPDLAIESAEVIVAARFTPGVPVMMFMVTVKNEGKGVYRALSESAILKVVDSTGKWGAKLPIPDLMPGESVELAVPLMEYTKDSSYMRRGRTHQFEVSIMPGKAPDKNLSNNIYGPITVKIPEIKKESGKNGPLPDLAVKSITFVRRCTVGIVLQNSGPGEIPDSVWETKDGEKAKLTIYLFDKKWSEKPIVEVDPERKLQKPGGKLIYIPGLRIRRKGRIRVVADSFNFIKETNEKNNSKEVTLYCRKKPDLYVSMIKVVPQRPKVGQKVKVMARVRNAGNAPAAPTRVAIFIGKERVPKTFEIPRLRPGRYSTAIRTVTFRRAEKKKVVAIADYGNRVKEARENNNKKIGYFRVRK